MALSAKYAELISAAQSSGIANLQVREQDGVLYVDGDAPSEAAKQQLWDIYSKIDPEFRGGDLVMKIDLLPGATPAAPAAVEEYEVVSGDNLSKIGHKFGLSWKELYEANKELIGSDPNKIFPGQKLKVPAKSA